MSTETVYVVCHRHKLTVASCVGAVYTLEGDAQREVDRLQASSTGLRAYYVARQLSREALAGENRAEPGQPGDSAPQTTNRTGEKSNASTGLLEPSTVKSL